MKIKFGIIPDIDVSTEILVGATNYYTLSKSLLEGGVDVLAGNYGTLEKDFTKLDGTFYPMPSSTPNLGVWGRYVSKADSTFDNPLTVRLTINKTISVAGMTLNCNCSEVNIAYYLNNTLVTSGTLSIPSDGGVALVGQDINKVVLTFTKTTEPYRRAKVSHIGLGIGYTFTDDDISSCKVVEEVSPYSMELPSNYCDFTLYSESGMFSILSANSILPTLYKNQSLEVYDDDDNFLGKFYLADWQNTQNGELSCKSYDLTKLLDDTNCINAAGLYENRFSGMSGWVPIYYILKKILDESAAKNQYTFDTTIYDPLQDEESMVPEDQRGHFYLKHVTSRQGLLTVLINNNYIADCARSSTVNVRKLNTTNVYTINDVFDGYTIKQTKRFARVDVNVTIFSDTTSITEKDYFIGQIAKDVEYEVDDFCEVIYVYSGTTVIGTADNTWWVTPASNAESGRIAGYVVDTANVIASKSQSVAGPQEVCTVESNCTDVASGKELATRLLEYSNNNLQVELETLFDKDLKTGNLAQVTVEDTTIKGYVTRQEIDVTSGLVRIQIQGARV